jgi:glyoxylase-like metal-dependent hydrolase (beta-lactamase superfamily II)
MIEEIVPDLYRNEIPLPNSPLKSLNSYIVRGEDRFLIIDTGFNREECQNEMNVSLQKLGVDLNKTDIFVTHFHVDHIGLADSLATENSKVYLNETEAHHPVFQDNNLSGYQQKLLDVYVANGFPAESARISLESHPARKYGLKRKRAFSVVKDGDIMEVGDFHFQCIATAGHSPGHMCLYEPNRKILVAGDHILGDITPNIAYWLEMDDPLDEYLTNLEKVRALDIKVVLPGHRRLVRDLHKRISELQEHHRDRLNEVLAALRDGAKTAFQIAPCITWDIAFNSWKEFPPAQKWFAFSETLAHVKFLENKGRVRRHSQSDGILYSIA